jgi:hypothetical protein
MLALLVLAIIGVGQIFTSGPTRQPLLDTATAEPAISADPKDDDSAILNSEPPPTIAVSPGTAAPEAVAYAFASAWVDHRNVPAKKWLEGLLPHATEKLASNLKGVDPAGVPADRITGRPDLKPVGDGLADAVVTADTGKLRLRLVAPDGHWLVDGVDWEQSS